jgi:hypothetical protein
VTYSLLLGAGFSRNWGGWLATEAFEYLLGCPEVVESPPLADLLWRSQQTGGFENALSELQQAVTRDPGRHDADLQRLQRAVSSMFVVMNNCFSRVINFDGTNNAGVTIRRFLGQFDAIFTLNQDILLEHQYLSLDIALLSNRRVTGSELPGMRPIPNSAPHPTAPVWISQWTPLAEDEFRVSPQCQPYFKLHGSSNWQTGEGGSMLIMGGNKAHEIGLSPVLQWYQTEFENRVSGGNDRLMIIGYGFRDEHINRIICNAVTNHGLKLFVVSPDGADQARKIAPSEAGAIHERTTLENVFQQGLVGASRRSLHEVFGIRDGIELSKFLRFIER